MKNFRTYTLAVEFYHLTRPLKAEAHLKSQLARAASSIVLNLAEGAGRATRKDQAHFFRIAFGSIREVQAIFDLAEPSAQLLEFSDKLAAHIFQLIKTCERG